jgi:hypothetical protein
MVKNMKQAIAAIDRIMKSDRPFSNKRLQKIISRIIKSVKENKWQLDDKIPIMNKINDTFSFLKAERGLKEDVEEDELQLAKRTDDGGEQSVGEDFVP